MQHVHIWVFLEYVGLGVVLEVTMVPPVGRGALGRYRELIHSSSSGSCIKTVQLSAQTNICFCNSSRRLWWQLLWDCWFQRARASCARLLCPHWRSNNLKEQAIKLHSVTCISQCLPTSEVAINCWMVGYFHLVSYWLLLLLSLYWAGGARQCKVGLGEWAKVCPTLLKFLLQVGAEMLVCFGPCPWFNSDDTWNGWDTSGWDT